jgi:hypothetical protein
MKIALNVLLFFWIGLLASGLTKPVHAQPTNNSNLTQEQLKNLELSKILSTEKLNDLEWLQKQGIIQIQPTQSLSKDSLKHLSDDHRALLEKTRPKSKYPFSVDKKIVINESHLHISNTDTVNFKV